MTLPANKFPNLAGKYMPTSPPTKRYNCIAWAVGDDTRWWWPDPENVSYWPPAAPRRCTISAFEKAFATMGFTPTSNSDFESSKEKIVLYVNADGSPTHAARLSLDEKLHLNNELGFVGNRML